MASPGLDSVVCETVRRHALLAQGRGAVVVLMVSGGSDSVALAQLLPRLYPQNAYTVLHINHQLRGEDADEDERFVVDLATRLGLFCVSRRVDVAARAAQTGDNLEQAGREARYGEARELLDELCEQRGCDPADGRIATAHTRDDRVETFFMRAIVGGGAGALSSIPYRNGRVVRPLLDCSREQLRDYLLTSEQANNYSLWREDGSNRDTTRLRAFVRHEVMPLARTRNPRLLETVARSLDVLTCDDAFLTRLANELTERLVTWGDGDNGGGNGAARINAALFAEDQALVRRVIKAVCDRVAAPGTRLTSAHIVRIAELGNHVGFVTVVPGDVMVANEYGTLVFRRKTDGGAPHCPPFPLPGGGEQRSGWAVVLREGCVQRLLDGRRIECVRVAHGTWGTRPEVFARAHASATQVFIDGGALERAGGVLRVSEIQPGDRFCPLGMRGHHRLVSDVLIDRKVPRRTRAGMVKVSTARTPSAALDAALDEEGSIVWVVGVQLDERFKVDATTTAMFSIIVTEDERTQHCA